AHVRFDDTNCGTRVLVVDQFEQSTNLWTNFNQNVAIRLDVTGNVELDTDVYVLNLELSGSRVEVNDRVLVTDVNQRGLARDGSYTRRGQDLSFVLGYQKVDRRVDHERSSCEGLNRERNAGRSGQHS